ncbi:MAG TPA: ADP-ribosylation factor-like protein [Thermoanaerobaculia bacterium]|nr:ADP-ribosylation factor-like protein [Thermoanaerobaculia bacterium]
MLVLRIAYAGAPLSGKTATMKALMPILRSQSSGDLVYSPKEARGRTIYFDWAEYQGGSFRGGQVQCQITSVPGQESLRRRRNLLIEDADAVVFVVDSQPDQMEANRRSLAELHPWLERNDLQPINVVYQCNKRDLPGTLGLEEIRSELSLGAEAELYESSAVQGDGLRIAFVAAVSAGVRRAEMLRGLNRLPVGTPEVETGEQLLDRVRLADDPNAQPEAESEPEAERTPEPSPAVPPSSIRARPAVMPMADWLASRQESIGTEKSPETAPAAETPVPEPKAPEPAPQGAAPTTPQRPAVMPMADWMAQPDGPNGIEEAAATPSVLPIRPPAQKPTTTLPAPWLAGGETGLLKAWPRGIWDAVRLAVDLHLDPPKGTSGTLQGRIGGGWHARSSGIFGSLDEGRVEYQRQVDWLMRLGDVVSGQRCIVLSGGVEGWRAWQLVRELPTLGMLLQQGLEPGLPSRKAVQILTRISAEFVSTCRAFTTRDVELPLLLRTLAQENGKTVYSAFLPNAPVPSKDRDALAHLESELRPLAKAHLLGALNIPETLLELEQLSVRSPSVLPIVELLQSLLIGE